MDFTKYSINQLINKEYECSCGKTHLANIKNIAIGERAVLKLKEIILAQKLNECRNFDSTKDKVLVVCDINTAPLAEEYVTPILSEMGVSYDSFVYQKSEFHAEMKYVDELMQHITDEALIIAVGSGTINDICRYVAFEKKLPYYIVATATSMDGYSSNVSPIVVNNLKTTFICKCADAIIGDTQMLASAPMKMIAAGFGDIAGKYLAISDWKMSNIINGEYYCNAIGELVLFSVKKCVDNLDGLKNRDLKALEYLMESLVLIGIAMSYVGFSRPASSSEHHIAHFTEMKSIFAHEFGELHGTNVGMATVLISQMYAKFLELDIDFDTARNKADAFDKKQWEQNITHAYGVAAGEVLRLYDEYKQNNPDVVKTRIDAIEKNKTAVISQIEVAVNSTQNTAEHLEALSGKTSPKSYNLTAEEVKQILLYAKDLRNRYAALQLFYDLGVLEELVEYILNLHLK